MNTEMHYDHIVFNSVTQLVEKRNVQSIIYVVLSLIHAKSCYENLGIKKKNEDTILER